MLYSISKRQKELNQQKTRRKVLILTRVFETTIICTIFLMLVRSHMCAYSNLQNRRLTAYENKFLEFEVFKRVYTCQGEG
jgi:hypothetical protein